MSQQGDRCTDIWGRSLTVPLAMEPGLSALVPSFTWPVELLFVLFLFKDVQALWESIFPVALITLHWNKQQDEGTPILAWLCFDLLFFTADPNNRKCSVEVQLDVATVSLQSDS